MHDIATHITQLRRPRLLNQAARYGAQRYCRTRALAPFFPHGAPERAGPTLAKLLEIEATLDAQRRTRAPDYQPRQHVQAMIAVLGETARLPDGSGYSARS